MTDGPHLDAPLFEARSLRVAIDGAVAIEHTDLITRGSRLALVGDVASLMSLLTNVPLGSANDEADVSADPSGVATVAAGSLRVAGTDVEGGLHLARSGVAPRDPPLPSDLLAQDYVAWSGRLAGLSKGLATGRASDALDRVGLQKHKKRNIAALGLPERRALLLAAAMVNGPEVLIADAPLAGLEGAAAAFVLAALAAACDGRASITSLTRMTPATPEGQIAASSTDVAFFSRGELMLSGRPTQLATGARLFGLTVRSNADALKTELDTLGIQLTGGPLRFAAHLPEGRGTGDILAAASAARAAVVELLALM